MSESFSRLTRRTHSFRASSSHIAKLLAHSVLDPEHLQAVAYMTQRLAVCGIEPPEHGRYSVDSPKVYILYIIVTSEDINSIYYNITALTLDYVNCPQHHRLII